VYHHVQAGAHESDSFVLCIHVINLDLIVFRHCTSVLGKCLMVKEVNRFEVLTAGILKFSVFCFLTP
jgi:hypothetical protein